MCSHQVSVGIFLFLKLVRQRYATITQSVISSPNLGTYKQITLCLRMSSRRGQKKNIQVSSQNAENPWRVSRLRSVSLSVAPLFHFPTAWMRAPSWRAISPGAYLALFFWKHFARDLFSWQTEQFALHSFKCDYSRRDFARIVRRRHEMINNFIQSGGCEWAQALVLSRPVLLTCVHEPPATS